MKYYFRCAYCMECPVTKETFEKMFRAIDFPTPGVYEKNQGELETAKRATISFSSRCPLCSSGSGQSSVTVNIEEGVPN